MIELSVSASGIDKQVVRLGLCEQVLRDLRPTFDAVVHPWLLEHQKQQFATSGRHGGKPWAPLTGEPKYAGMKRALGASMAPLRWKPGRQECLYPSLTQSRHPLHRWQAGKARASFGTSVKYADRLQKGGKGPKGERFPPRVMFAYTNAQVRDLVRAMQRDILRRVGGDSFRSARNAGTL